MSASAWKISTIALEGSVPRAFEKRSWDIGRLARINAKTAPRRLARLMEKQYVQKNGYFDPLMAVRGFDNRQKKNRFSGCAEEYGLSSPQMGFYCASLSTSGIFAPLATEGAFYASEGAKTYKKLQVNPDLDLARKYFEPSVIFPNTKILIEYEQITPLPAYAPFDDARELGILLGQELEMVTEHLWCIYKDAPQLERDKWITPAIERELAGMHSMGKKRLGLSCLLEHPQYMVSAPMGNAILSSGVALSWESVRGDVVPQKKFLDGARNLVLPVQPDLSTGLVTTKLHRFDVHSRKFVWESADPGISILPL